MKYIKYIVLVLSIIVSCTVAVLIYNDIITEDAPRYYKQGSELYDSGDYSNAYYNFAKINQISPLYNISLFKQAKSAQKAGDYNTASIKYKMFIEKEPKSIFIKSAKMNYAKSCYYSKQYENAMVAFEDLLKEDDLTKAEATYFAGLTAKQIGDGEKSVKYLKEYLRYALDKDAKHKDYILAAAQELSSSGAEFNDDDNKLIGIAYYKSGKCKKSIEYFSLLPYEKGWDWFVLANHYAGNKVIARKLIETGLITYAKYSASDNLKNIYSIYTSYMPGSRFRNWQTMLETVKNNDLPSKDYVLYKLADMLTPDKSITYYADIAVNHAQGDYAAEALRRVFFHKYINGDYSGAEEIALKHISLYPKAKSAPCMLFWAAKTFEKENKLSEAHTLYSKLISKFPDDYYALRAASINDKRSDFWKTVPGAKIPGKAEMPQFPIMMSDIDMGDLKVINTIFDAGDYDIWQDADFRNPVVESWFERRKGNKSRSIVLARDEIERIDLKPPYLSSAYKLAYPRYWSEEINRIASENNLDAYFVTALIREESYFNNRAKSVTYASGLMQLMPDTATFVLGMLNKDLNSEEGLEDPESNITLGCAYLKYLRERFDGNDLLTIAAYNGGEGSVRKWIKQFGTDDYDLFIERIPFDETRNYVKKVFRSYCMYKKVYG